MRRFYDREEYLRMYKEFEAEGILTLPFLPAAFFAKLVVRPMFTMRGTSGITSLACRSTGITSLACRSRATRCKS